MRYANLLCVVSLCLVACEEARDPVSLKLVDACSVDHALVPTASRIQVSVHDTEHGLAAASFDHAAGSGRLDVVPGTERSVISVVGVDQRGDPVFAMGIAGVDLLASEGSNLGVVVGPPDAFIQSTYSTEQAGLCSYLHSQRRALAGALLPDGRVMLAGGEQRNPTSVQVWDTLEFYDPRTGAFSEKLKMPWQRRNHTATTTTSGLVVIAGGQGHLEGNSTDTLETWRTASVFDPAREGFRGKGIPMMAQRANHTAAAISRDRVLIVGGNNEDTVHASTEIIDLKTGRSKLGPSLNTPRAHHAMVQVSEGVFAVIGGQSAEGPVNSIEWIIIEEVQHDRVTQESMRVAQGPTLQYARVSPAVSYDAARHVLIIAGGFTENLPTTGDVPDRILGVSGHVDVVLVNEATPALSRNVCNASAMPQGRAWSGVIPVADGMVLAGGIGASGEPLNDALHVRVKDLSQCVLETQSTHGELTKGRIAPTVVMLGDGDALLAGGLGDVAGKRVSLDTADIYVRAR